MNFPDLNLFGKQNLFHSINARQIKLWFVFFQIILQSNFVDLNVNFNIFLLGLCLLGGYAYKFWKMCQRLCLLGGLQLLGTTELPTFCLSIPQQKTSSYEMMLVMKVVKYTSLMKIWQQHPLLWSLINLKHVII